MDQFISTLKANSRMILATAAVLYALKKYADLKAPHHTIAYSMTTVERDEPPAKEIYPQYFKTKAGLWLHVRRWQPHATSGYTSLPRGIVFLVHGYAEHIGRYEHIAERLAKMGYYVCGLDHQGHGQSDGDRAHVERFEHFVQDYLAFMGQEQASLTAEWQARHATTQFDPIPTPPCFILGHSMGGLIAYFLALAIQGVEPPRTESLFSPGLDETKSLMLSPLPSKLPSVTPNPASPTSNRTPAMLATTNSSSSSLESAEAVQLRRCSSVSPTNPQSIVGAAKGLWPLRGVIFSSPAFALDPWTSSATTQFFAGIISAVAPKLGVATLDVNGISSIPQVVARYQADPLNYTGMVRARFGFEFASAIKRACSSFPNFTVPFLIIHGERDRVCPPVGSRDLYAKAASEDKSLKIYNKSLHEVFLDVDAPRALLDVMTWLRDRSDSSE